MRRVGSHRARRSRGAVKSTGSSTEDPDLETMEDVLTDFSIDELREFLEADLLDVPMDPVFKERLRERLWALGQERARREIPVLAMLTADEAELLASANAAGRVTKDDPVDAREFLIEQIESDPFDRYDPPAPGADAVLLVTTPSEAARHVVARSARLLREAGVGRAGPGANMASWTCPHCGIGRPPFPPGGAGRAGAARGRVPDRGSTQRT